MTNKQLEVARDIKEKKPRHVIFHGAVRSGKTYIGILLWVAYIKKYEGQNKLFIMTGHTISSLKRNVLDDMSKMFGINTHLDIRNEFQLFGNRIACFGTDKADSFKSMRGLTAQGWYANEVILSHVNSVLEAFARCSEPNAMIEWETNPDKPNHYIKTNYIDKSGNMLNDGGYNIIAYHFELEDNTFLDKTYIESLKSSIPSGTIYDRQIKGYWKATEKAIFKNLVVINSTPKEFNDCTYGLDFGFNNPCALVQIFWLDNGIAIKPLFQISKLKEKGLVEEVSKYIINKNTPLYCDNAEPDKIQALLDAGFNAIKANKSVEEGIRYLQNFDIIYLINDDTAFISSMENYEFQSNSSGEVMEIPIKRDDHYPDAVRYGTYSHKDNISTGNIFDFGFEEIDYRY